MLETTKLKPEWWSLFDPDLPNDPMIRSALIGRSPGVAYVNRIDQPAQIVVRDHYGTTFAGSRVTATFLSEAIDRARKRGWVSLIDNGVPDEVRANGEVVDRLHFDDCDLQSKLLQVLRGQLPTGFEVLDLDRRLFELCHHCNRELPRIYGDELDRFFDFGYGICLMHDGEVVSEAYAGYVAEGRAEVIVGTVEACRGQGLASIACAFLAEAARARGDVILWSCLASNPASIATARHLGFESERHYQVIYL
jgi:GNAT superfamily N-acetyltransferase